MQVSVNISLVETFLLYEIKYLFTIFFKLVLPNVLIH